MVSFGDGYEKSKLNLYALPSWVLWDRDPVIENLWNNRAADRPETPVFHGLNNKNSKVAGIRGIPMLISQLL
jgi:hypothetical protein